MLCSIILLMCYIKKLSDTTCMIQVLVSTQCDPSQPQVTVKLRAANSVTVSIATIGHVEYYISLVNNRKRNDRIKFTASPQTTTINNLSPGSVYIIQFVAVSYGLMSVPSIGIKTETADMTFNVSATTTTTDIHLSIIDTVDYTNYYLIYRNGNFVSKHQRVNGTQTDIERTDVYIANCIPGTMYNITVLAMADGNNTTHVKSLMVATDPGKPRNITEHDEQFYTVFTLGSPAGNVDGYKVLASSVCETSTKMPVSYSVEQYKNTKNEFILQTDSGACCRLDIVSIANKKQSIQSEYFVSRKETVPGKVDSVSADQSGSEVSLLWNAPLQPNGVIVEYTLQFGIDDKTKLIMFNCIECQTNCLFLKNTSSNSNKRETVGKIKFDDDKMFYVLTFKGSNTRFTFSISGLTQGSIYQYSITAATATGSGPAFNSSLTPSKEENGNGPLIGGIIGAAIGSAIFTSIAFYLYKRYRHKPASDKETSSAPHYDTIGQTREESVYDDLAL